MLQLLYNSCILQQSKNKKGRLIMKTKGIYKLISLILAITLIFSVLGTTAFALETEEETKIYFEVPTLEEWGTTKNAYCHIYNVYGGSPLIETMWQNKTEKCSCKTIQDII